MNITKLKPEQIKAVLMITGGVIVLVFAAILIYDFSGAISTVTSGLGLGESKTDKKIEDAKKTSITQDYFNPAFYQQSKTAKILMPAIIDKMVENLLSSISSVLHDVDDSKIEAVFTHMKFKTQVSELAYYFQHSTGQSLANWLEKNLNPSAPELLLAALNDKRKNTYANILSRLNNLPSGL